MESEQQNDNADAVDRGPHFVDDAGVDDVRAWEEIAAGRFMPRRIKGSCKGRALG